MISSPSCTSRVPNFQNTTGEPFWPLRTCPPSSVAWRKVSQYGDAYPLLARIQTLIPRYGCPLTRLRGSPPSPGVVQGLCHGAVPDSSCFRIRSVMTSYTFAIAFPSFQLRLVVNGKGPRPDECVRTRACELIGFWW